MTTPPIPPEARPFLRYLPTIAEYIRADRRPSRGELSLLRTFARDAFETLRSLTYEGIVAFVSPFEADPQFAEYVQLVRSDRGRAWITAVLADIKAV